MTIGFLTAVMSRTTSRQDRLKLCMTILAIMSLVHQEEHFRRMIRDGDSRNMQHFLLMNMRSDPSGVSHPHHCEIIITIENGTEEEFRGMFRVSRPVFSALLTDLGPYLRDGRSRNHKQNVSAELKLGIALYYMAHGGSGKHLSSASGLKKCTALKYLYLVSNLICIHMAPKFMGDALLDERDYMKDCRARFHARNGFPNVGGCIDGTHIPYMPQHPALRDQLKSSNPILRREAHATLFYHFKPRDF